MRNNNIPSWVPKVVITSLIGALITFALAWASSTSLQDTKQDTDIAVLKAMELTNSNRLERIENKLDKALEK